jgi:hypothetical protein
MEITFGIRKVMIRCLLFARVVKQIDIHSRKRLSLVLHADVSAKFKETNLKNRTLSECGAIPLNGPRVHCLRKEMTWSSMEDGPWNSMWLTYLPSKASPLTGTYTSKIIPKSLN